MEQSNEREIGKSINQTRSVVNFLLILRSQHHSKMDVPALFAFRIIVFQENDPIVGYYAALEIMIQVPNLLAFIKATNFVVVAEG